MSVDEGVRHLKSEADEPGWEADPDDDWGLAVIATVGRQLRLRREAVGMRAADFQTPEYARGLLLMRRPAYTQDDAERMVAGRVARQTVFEKDPVPELSFVLEEWTLRRPLGGRALLRDQLEHLLEVGRLRNIGLQVMPMNREEHAGLAGEIEVLAFGDGSAARSSRSRPPRGPGSWRTPSAADAHRNPQPA